MMLLWVTTLTILPSCYSLVTPHQCLRQHHPPDPHVRDHLHYHIKCSKACIHTCAKTSDFLKMLNCAHLDAEKKEMKTIMGNTFSSRSSCKQEEEVAGN